MKEKYLAKIRQLEELRKRYHEERDEKTYGSPAKISDLKDIYGKRIDSAKGCLILLSHIIKAYKIGEYQFTVHDPIFHTLDDRYHSRIRKLMRKKHKIKKENQELEELHERYEKLHKRVRRINKKLIKEMFVPKSKLEDLVNESRELDDLEPTDEELNKMELREGSIPRRSI
jgi:valyl-tRNA synthetase